MTCTVCGVETCGIRAVCGRVVALVGSERLGVERTRCLLVRERAYWRMLWLMVSGQGDAGGSGGRAHRCGDGEALSPRWGLLSATDYNLIIIGGSLHEGMHVGEQYR